MDALFNRDYKGAENLRERMNSMGEPLTIQELINIINYLPNMN
jgi:hypothetical protein